MDIINNEILSKLCAEYNFDAPELTGGGQLVSIKSKRDLWYIPNLEYYEGKTNIKLLHANTWGKSGYHYQKSFTSHRKMFEYILAHDNKYSINSLEVKI